MSQKPVCEHKINKLCTSCGLYFTNVTTFIGPLHILWQVSFGCWVTWSISSWQKYHMSVFFPKVEWWVAELIFLSLNNWGLKFQQNKCSQFSQIYLSSEKLSKVFTFQSWKFCQIAKCQIVFCIIYSSATHHSALGTKTLLYYSCQLEIDHVTQQPKETCQRTCRKA